MSLPLSLGWRLGSRLIPREKFEDEDDLDELIDALVEIRNAGDIWKLGGLLIGGQVNRNIGTFAGGLMPS